MSQTRHRNSGVAGFVRLVASLVAVAAIVGLVSQNKALAQKQSGLVVSEAENTSVYDAFMKINRFREAPAEDEDPDEYWGQLQSRLENQAGRNLIKRPTAMSEKAFNGWLSFMRTYGDDNGIGKCAACHKPPMFTDGKPHNIATGDKQAATPPLRNLHDKKSFFHDDSAKSLEEAIRIHVENGRIARQRKTELVDLELGEISLSDKQIEEVAEFVRSLKTVDRNTFRDYLLEVEIQPLDFGY